MKVIGANDNFGSWCQQWSLWSWTTATMVTMADGKNGANGANGQWVTMVSVVPMVPISPIAPFFAIVPLSKLALTLPSATMAPSFSPMSRIRILALVISAGGDHPSYQCRHRLSLVILENISPLNGTNGDQWWWGLPSEPLGSSSLVPMAPMGRVLNWFDTFSDYLNF